MCVCVCVSIECSIRQMGKQAKRCKRSKRHGGARVYKQCNFVCFVIRQIYVMQFSHNLLFLQVLLVFLHIVLCPSQLVPSLRSRSYSFCKTKQQRKYYSHVETWKTLINKYIRRMKRLYVQIAKFQCDTFFSFFLFIFFHLFCARV